MQRLMLSVLMVLLLSATTLTAVANSAPSHDGWDALLQRHVQWTDDGTASVVDYAGMRAQRGQLDAYLEALAEVTATEFDGWPKPDRDAFLINAYNAATVQLVLTRDPLPESIKQIGGWFSSPWKQSFVPLLGQTRSLDEIEHGLLRGSADYDDPRIHFAVNCASVGCPALRPEAYSGARLDAQLQDQTARFLRDASRNRYLPEADRLEVSRIFDWYGGDFERHSGGVAAFLAGQATALRLDPALARRLQAGKIRIGFTDYDWRLNIARP